MYPLRDLFNVIMVSLPHWEGELCTPDMYFVFCIYIQIITIMASVVHY